MAELLKVAPQFLQRGSGDFFISPDTLTAVARNEYLDTFDEYQRLFGIYSYMQLNQKLKYEVITPKAHPFGWVQGNGCACTPSKLLMDFRKELTPTEMCFATRFCWDAIINSAYEHLLNYRSSGETTLNDEGIRLFNTMIDELIPNINMGLRYALTLGNLYNFAQVSTVNDNGAEIATALRTTYSSAITGWMQSAALAADAGKAHMRYNGMFDNKIEDGIYTGNPVTELYDVLRRNAPREMRHLINTGATTRRGQNFTAMFVVSSSVYSSVVEYYNTIADSPMQNRVRVTVQEIPRGAGQLPFKIYYIDNTPVVPLSDVCAWDGYLEGETHFAGLISSGNIQLGTSFGSIPSYTNNSAGLIIARDDNAASDTYGTYAIRSATLGATAIADTNYFTAAFDYAV